ncbi:MAG: hypothetical protein ABJA66_06585 [Actinomycetota bacterium]
MSKGKFRITQLLLPLTVILFLSGVAAAQEWTWKTFSPPDGAWSILAPGVMNPDAEAKEAGSKVGSYAYSDFYGFFTVVYRDSPQSFWSLKPDYSNYFKKVRKDFVKAGKGELLREEKYVNGDSIGREVHIKIPTGQMVGTEGQTITKYRVERLRMFFHNKRFYLLLVVLPADSIDTPAIDNYFNSFVAK